MSALIFFFRNVLLQAKVVINYDMPTRERYLNWQIWRRSNSGQLDLQSLCSVSTFLLQLLCVTMIESDEDTRALRDIEKHYHTTTEQLPEPDLTTSHGIHVSFTLTHPDHAFTITFSDCGGTGVAVDGASTGLVTDEL